MKDQGNYLIHQYEAMVDRVYCENCEERVRSEDDLKQVFLLDLPKTKLFVCEWCFEKGLMGNKHGEVQ